jgi:hypothetical protein
MTIMTMPTSRRSIRRMNGLVAVVFVEALFVIRDHHTLTQTGISTIDGAHDG